MGIFIPKKKMPEDCTVCIWWRICLNTPDEPYTFCGLTKENLEFNNDKKPCFFIFGSVPRPKSCPLVEISDDVMDIFLNHACYIKGKDNNENN